MPTLPLVSQEYLYVDRIAAFDQRSPDAAADPKTLAVRFAFMPNDAEEPTDADWHDGEWFDNVTARVLVGGSAGVALAAGPYYVWLSILGATEVPKRIVGRLNVQ